MSGDGVYTSVDGPIAEVALNAPPVNAVTTQMYETLIATFRDLSVRTDVHVVLLRSELANGFSAGADIKQTVAAPSVAESADEYRARLARTCYDTIINCAQPTIAVINGYALGAGAVLAASCDIRYAADTATIGLPEINAGRCGGGRHLMRLVPQGKTRLMYFTGEPINAHEAFRLDLVQGVFPADSLMSEARALAQRIAAKSPLGLRLAKRALNECESMEVGIGYKHEQRYTLELAQTPDAREAVLATLEKRQPVWSWGRTEAEAVATGADF
jgi:enoyl-CoA hydratase